MPDTIQDAHDAYQSDPSDETLLTLNRTVLRDASFTDDSTAFPALVVQMTTNMVTSHHAHPSAVLQLVAAAVAELTAGD